MREPVARSSGKSDGKCHKTGPYGQLWRRPLWPISFSPHDGINSNGLNKEISQAVSFIIKKITAKEHRVFTFASPCYSSYFSSSSPHTFLCVQTYFKSKDVFKCRTCILLVIAANFATILLTFTIFGSVSLWYVVSEFFYSTFLEYNHFLFLCLLFYVISCSIFLYYLSSKTYFKFVVEIIFPFHTTY